MASRRPVQYLLELVAFGYAEILAGKVTGHAISNSLLCLLTLSVVCFPLHNTWAWQSPSASAIWHSRQWPRWKEGYANFCSASFIS